MDSMTRGFSAVLLAVAVAAVPASAQVTLGGPTVGPAGGVASTTAPSNSEGTPAGGTGVIGTTRVGPSTTRASTPRHHVRRVRHRAHHAARHRAADINSAAGLNGSEAPSR